MGLQRCGSVSAAEDDVDAGEDERELARGELAGALSEEVAIQGHDLRDVGDRIARQACRPGAQGDVAGGLGPAEVGGEGDADGGSDAAAVEGVTLHDDDGAPEPESGAGGRREVGPPDVSLSDYRSLRAWVRAAAAAKAGSDG